MLFIDSSSDEEELLDMKIVRRSLRDKSNPLSLREKEFRKHFRLSKEAFKFVLDRSNIPHGSKGTVIPPVLKLAATLNLLGSGSYQLGVGHNFLLGMAQSSVSKVTNEVISILENELCSNWIQLNPEHFPQTKASFFAKYNLPGVVGCIDGTHVMILKPNENEHMYFNRKGCHSVNVMIICDHSYRILAINPCYGGAAHDSFIWGLSEEKIFFERKFDDGDRSSWLLGDSGYPLAPWLLTPYRTINPNTGEETFNKVHSKARSIVERTIGIWKGRWRCLQDERRMRYSPEKVASIASVCAALHNICLHFKVSFNSISLYSPQSNLNPDLEESSGTQLRIGEKIRNQIKNSLINNSDV